MSSFLLSKSLVILNFNQQLHFFQTNTKIKFYLGRKIYKDIGMELLFSLLTTTLYLANLY